jgi:regulator of sirC expression with transglutaminase-like and TPR domain
VDPSSRFRALLERPEAEIRLDEASLLVAAHAYPSLDLSHELSRLDELADTCYAPTLDALVRHLFVDLGFVGNDTDYYDPRNSYLNEVTARRTGIPITLSVLTIEVGRRIGVPLAGVSMPGHFLLRDRVDTEVFVDPFARGALIDRRAAERAFHAVHGDDAPFDSRHLEPVGAHAILARLLANLRGIFLARNDAESLLWVLSLRVDIPGVPRDERRELAGLLAGAGRFDEAASQYDTLADQLEVEDRDDEADRCRRSARQLRARLN